MKTITLFDKVGAFAENKDIARKIRNTELEPALQNDEEITLDFTDVESATQSFIHALLSELIRIHGAEVIDKLSFKNCSETVKKIIGIVLDYMQESV